MDAPAEVQVASGCRDADIDFEIEATSASNTDTTTLCLKTSSTPFCGCTVNLASTSHFYPISRNRSTGKTRQSYGEKDPSLDQIGWQFQAAGDQKPIRRCSASA